MPRDPYARFAKYYDMLYEHKLDYATEARWLLRAFHKFGKNVHSVLDLGCGTGGHALPLAAKGYEIVGLDRSGNMLAAAKKKARQRRLRVRFVQADMSSFRLGRRFDAIVCMFGGWGYVLNDGSVKSALRQVHDHLRSGGLFLVEFWGTGGVRPGSRHWDFVQKDVNLLRWSQSTYDPRTRQLTLTMHHIVYKGKRVIDEFTDRHTLRTYGLSEMRELLTSNGFSVKAILGYNHSGKGFARAGKKDFNIMAVAVSH